MIDFPITYRRVPWQSDVYEMDWTIIFGNHNFDATFFASGDNGINFAFGSNSGNYFASGSGVLSFENQKFYFENTSPGTERKYTFVVGPESYDIYDGDGSPLVFNASKSTGNCKQIFVETTSGANGQFEILLRGKAPSFSVTSGVSFPLYGQSVDRVIVFNTSDIPFHILSGSLDFSSVSGLSALPLFVPPLSSGEISLSGSVPTQEVFPKNLVLYADYTSGTNFLTISGTIFSGSGYMVSVPDMPTVYYESTTNALFSLSNTGTQILTFTPTVNPVTLFIDLGIPSYSGYSLNNYFSGFFDTTRDFYFSDYFATTGANFYLIQEWPSGSNLIETTGTPLSGLALGSESGVQVGQAFAMPFDFLVTGFRAKLAAVTGTFGATDYVLAELRDGIGTTGSVLATSNQVLCTGIPSGLSAADFSSFYFPAPLQLASGQDYSLVLSGNSDWVGIPSTGRKILLCQTNGGFGSGFYNATGDEFGNAAIFMLPWEIPSNSTRFLVNQISGNVNGGLTIQSGYYDKYMAHKCFGFYDSLLAVLPGETHNFDMKFSGMSYGINPVQISFSGIGYQVNFSGEVL